MARSQATESVRSFLEWAKPIWEERMLLDRHKIEYVYLDEFYPDDDENSPMKTTAVTHTRWEYSQAKINWYLPSAARHDFGTLEEFVVHENWHVVLAPEQCHLKDAHSEHWEKATEDATRITLKAYEGRLLGANYGT